MSDFSGRRGLVTGAGTGIGRASAIAFAQRGAAVAVIDIDDAQAATTVEMIETAGGRAIALHADVAQPAQIAAAVEAAVAAFGGLDFAHNNAGTSAGVAALADVDDADWHRVMDINLHSVYHSMRAELPHLVAAGGGAIVNTASNAGLYAVGRMPAYVASKHAVVGLTKSVALDYGPQGIRANALCPGYIRTPLLESFVGTDEAPYDAMAEATPLRRVGTPQEAALGAVWLCSDEASFVTGVAFTLDGGRRL